MPRVNLFVLIDDLKVHKDYASESDVTDARLVRMFNQAQAELAREMYTADSHVFGYSIDYTSSDYGTDGTVTIPPTMRKLQYVEHKGSGNHWYRVDKRPLRQRSGIHETSNKPTSGTFRLNYCRRLPNLQYGIAVSATATTIVLATSPTYGDVVIENDYFNGATIEIVSGTGAGQQRVITDYVVSGTTYTATVATWGTNPTSSSVYNIVCEIPEDFYYDGMIWGALTRLTNNADIERKYLILKDQLRSAAMRDEQEYPSLVPVDEHMVAGYFYYLRGQKLHLYES